MKDNSIHNIYLEQAIAIADEILAKAEHYEDTLFWKTTYSTLGDKDVAYQVNESIYNGTGGIIYLFLELYKETKEEKYKNAAELGIDWSIKHVEKNDSDYYAFLTGRMSTVFILLKANEILNNSIYLNIALRLTRSVRNFINNNVNDLINGLSGTLLVLLHLYSVTKEQWVLEEITEYTLQLINRAKPSEKGVYWDRTEKVIKPLCGLSHGASGVGFVILELGIYFNNPSLIWLGEAAFAYEREHFDRKENNWTDFRKGIDVFQDENTFLQAYLADDLPFFTEGRTMTAWCHGSPGIGLARLRAYELLKKPEYYDEAKLAAISVENSLLDKFKYDSFSLCHGNFGNLELLLELNQYCPQKKYREIIEKITAECQNQKEVNGFLVSGIAHQQEDVSLFLGNAGIAYSYLRIFNIENHKSILIPSVDQKNINNSKLHNIDDTLVNTKLISKGFYRTLTLLLYLIPNQTNKFLSRTNSSSAIIAEWQYFVNKELIQIPNNEIVLNTFSYENFIWNQDCNQPSLVYANFKNDFLKSRAIAVSGAKTFDFGETFIYLRSDIIVKKLKQINYETFNNLNTSNLFASVVETDYILVPDYWGIKEIKIESDLLFAVLETFSTKKRIKDGVNSILSLFDGLELESDVENATDLIISQIRHGLVAGLFEVI